MSPVDAYDPNAPETSESSLSGQYMTKKDAKWMALGVGVFFIAMIPVFFYAKDARDKTLCTANLKDLYTAIGLYSTNNDDRYPLAYYEQYPGGPPQITDQGPITWVSTVGVYKGQRSSFVCPASQEEEKAYSVDLNNPNKRVASTYGFYTAYSGVARNSVDDPDLTFLFGETSNNGSRGSYDPLPFKNPDGSIQKSDGFAIGWNNSQANPDKSTKSVTRLAFQGSEKGTFAEVGGGRHSAGNIFITISGRKVLSNEPIVALTTWATGKYTLDSPWGSPVSKSGRE